jgi:phosphonate transport system substrate-binding protein
MPERLAISHPAQVFQSTDFNHKIQPLFTMKNTLIRLNLKSMLFSVLTVFLLTASFQLKAQNTLRVSAIPDESPTELQRKFKPLGDYLSKETGLKVEFTPVTDYAAVVEALASKKIDMAWLGGFTYVQAKLRTNGEVTPIIQRAEDEKFTSIFIVPVGSSVKSLAELKGKTMAFGSPSSTSGHLMPRYFLMQAGLNVDKDLKNIAFSGAHDATVAFVASGKAEAGVLNASVWEKLIESQNPNALKAKVLAVTPPFYDYNWTVRGGLEPATVKKISDAFLKLDANNPNYKELMDLQRASKYITTKSSNYDEIEKAARSAALIN